jgi:acyl homoserine lactone synthase
VIIGFTQASAYRHGDILGSMHSLRYRMFTERKGYKTPTWQGMEYDLYDNLSSVYLAWRDEHNVVRGTCRLAPTDRPYMIKDLWPQMIAKMELPNSPYIWEASRLCVDHTLSKELRSIIIGELVCAYQQIGLLNGMEYMIGVMAPQVWDNVFGKSGWKIEFIGPETSLDTGEVIIAGKMNISEAILANIMKTTGLEAPPLHITNDVLGLVDTNTALAEKEAAVA